MQARLLFGQHHRGPLTRDPMLTAIDLIHERLAGSLNLGERGILVARLMSFGTMSAFASFTDDSTPPLLAGSAG